MLEYLKIFYSESIADNSLHPQLIPKEIRLLILYILDYIAL